MSTFRQEQIQEILNYERTMNRLVLDKEIAQVSRFNEERNPPSNRDIKFEAILGNLIDTLKAKIAEALTSIASEQYPKNDASTATRLLDLKSGEDGSNARYVNQKTRKIAQELQGEYEKNYNNPDAPSDEGKKEEETNQVGVPQTQEEKQDIKEENENEEERGEGPTDHVGAVQLPEPNIIDEENKYAAPIIPQQETDKKLIDVLNSISAGIDQINAEYISHSNEPLFDADSYLENVVPAIMLLKKAIKRYFTITDDTRELQTQLLKLKDEFIMNKLRDIVSEGMSGRGKPNRFEKPKGYFGSGGKDRTSLEEEKSRTQHVKATENVLYDVITQYNGIIDKINQVTMPDGRFASRRTVSQQSIGFYSDVLKGLLEPIKHLIFELTSVRNPQLATTLNMMTNMKDLIEMAPPFQKINITAYKNGLPDFQGLNGEVTIDVNGYISDLTEYLTNIRRMKNNVDHQLNSVLFNLKDKSITDSVLESLKKKTEYYRELVGRIEKEIETVNARKRVTDELEVNTQLIKDAQDMFNNLQEFLTAPPPVEQDFIDIRSREPILPENESDYAYLVRTQLRNANDRLQTLEAYRNKYLEEYGDDYKDDELDEEISKLTRVKGRLEERFRRFVGALPESTDIIPYYQIDTEKKQLKTSGKNPREARAILLQQPGYDYMVKKLAKEQGIESSQGYRKGRKPTATIVKQLQHVTGLGQPDIGSGGTAGLADYLSTDAKPQYWHHRELSDDNKIHKQVVENNKEWQKFSNPPHTNPIGSLYPFNKKSEAEKYSFPLKLKHDLAILKPDDTQKDERGADISLLQGPIKPTVEEKMPRGRPSRRTNRTAKEAMNNILQGKGMDTGRNIGAGRNNYKAAKEKNPAVESQKAAKENNPVFDNRKTAKEKNPAFDNQKVAKEPYGEEKTMSAGRYYYKATKEKNPAVESQKAAKEKTPAVENQKVAKEPYGEEKTMSGTPDFTEHKLIAAGRHNSKALHKIIFDDEDNDQFDGQDYVNEDGGMIPEEEPEELDRFRNKKLGPKKKKSVKK
jgi:hypothetical protein